jgi:hypothetical protein
MHTLQGDEASLPWAAEGKVIRILVSIRPGIKAGFPNQNIELLQC